MEEKIRKLDELMAVGVLSDREYNEKRREIEMEFDQPPPFSENDPYETQIWGEPNQQLNPDIHLCSLHGKPRSISNLVSTGINEDGTPRYECQERSRCRCAGSSGGFEPGDWICQTCDAHNFAKRGICFKCQTPKGGGGGGYNSGYGPDALPFEHGDWYCPSCETHNFARRANCFRCQAPRQDGGYGGPSAKRFKTDPNGPLDEDKMICSRHGKVRAITCLYQDEMTGEYVCLPEYLCKTGPRGGGAYGGGPQRGFRGRGRYGYEPY
eukprot:NODE_6157_length_919_cov_40.679648_g5566_i0.p1 GENE.NODE_6157_length_919_cov_40.679648_g5566_i0~~NODE_6157_length_919_cov_40.679648_g5566_i0.p1  ORF type:complete len:267 (+),score=31.25 NODE_6157_length_919_cov_40.679648_g5566_i0:62-862(+)